MDAPYTMTDSPRLEDALGGWTCTRCSGFKNQAEDRYCGECGEPHNATIVRPVFAPTVPLTGLLADVPDPRPPLLQGALCVIFPGLAAAAIFGALYHYAARAVDLMIVFPVLLGLGVGWAIRVAAIRGRCHRAALLLGAAILSGVAAYGLRQTLDTVQFQKMQFARLAEDARDRDLVSGKKTVILYGFWDALRDRHETGAAFNFGHLRGRWFWFFLFVEAALVAGVAAASVRHVSRHAYCPGCRAFIPSVSVFRVNARDANVLADTVRRQQWKSAQEMSDRASATPNDRAEAALLSCALCSISSIRVDVRRGRRSKKVMHVALPPESLKALARSA